MTNRIQRYHHVHGIGPPGKQLAVPARCEIPLTFPYFPYPSIANRPHATNAASSLPPQSSTAAPKSRLFEGSNMVNKAIWGAVKSAGSTIKNTTQQAAAMASNQMRQTVGIKDPTKIEKRITDELHKMFDDADSFYYCLDGDITNNLQRNGNEWDERFFWNKHMLDDIFKLNVRLRNIARR